MSSAARAAGALFTINAARQFINQISDVRGEFQQLEISFKTMLGSEKKANDLMTQLAKTAASTPFDLTGVATGAKQLLAYGFGLEKVNDTLIMLGNVASGISAPLTDIVYLYGTLRASGRVMAMDIRQFAGRGIPIYEELAKVLGVNVDAINEMVSSGKVGFKDVEKAFQNMTSEGGRFDNLMAQQAQSITGLKSNFRDAIDMAENDLGKKLQPAIESIIKSGINLAENYEEVGRKIAEIIAIYGTYKAALITINAIQKLNMLVLRQAVLEKNLAAAASITLSNAEAIAAARTKLLSIAQIGLAKSMKAVGAAMLANPYVLVAAAIAGIAFAIYKVVSAKSELEKATDRMESAMTDSEKAALSEQRELTRLKGQLEGAKKGTEEYNAIKDKIVRNYGKYDSTLYAEIERVGLLDDKYKSLCESIKSAFDLKHYEKFTEAQGEALDETMSNNLDKMYDKLTGKFGDELGSKYYSEIKSALLSSLDGKINANEQLSTDLLHIIYGADSDGYYENPALNRYYENIKKVIKATEDADKVARLKFGIDDTATDSNTGDVGEDGKKLKVQDKDYWEKKKQEAVDAKDALDISKENSEEWQKYEKDIAEAQSKIDKYSDKEEKKKDKPATSKQELSDRLKEIQDAKNQIKEQEINGEYEIWQAKINAMKDGYDKEKAQIELNYQKAITDNRRLAQEMIKAQQEVERKEWETANPDWKEKGKVFTPSTVSVSQLSQSQQSQLTDRGQCSL